MAIHVVQQGECLSSIAKKHGFAAWRTIYDHAGNADLRKRRPNPNVLYPGDELYIPAKSPKIEPVSTGRTHLFRMATAQTFLTVKVAEHVGPPLVGLPYVLKLGDQDIQGTVPASGMIQHPIPVGLQEAELRVTLKNDMAPNSCYQWRLKIGHLDPVDTVTGQQARLNNLGFYSGPVDGELGPTTRTAVRQFQRAYGLVVDEIPGPKTQAKLKEVYGC